MGQIDSIQLSDALRKRLVNFAVDDNFIRDQKLRDVCRSVWSGRPEEGGLVSELWIEGAFPSKKSGVTLKALVESNEFNGVLQEQLDRRQAVRGDLELYSHQLEAIRSANGEGPRPGLVVTAGTGAGKTESFLLPVLNDLFSRRDQNGGGVKCLILYPMNALVNDQVDRIFHWLKEQNQQAGRPVTLFNFTSETPENKEDARKKGMSFEQDSCRLWTREEARKQVPDILVTNYSMLEYMLCRPQDSPFFGDGVRSIVLDEAHLYTGTLAAEMTLLLRRVLLRCGVPSSEVLQIATSATIGTGSDDELQQFASEIFSKDPSWIKVIKGERSRIEFGEKKPPVQEVSFEKVQSLPWQSAPTISLSNGHQELSKDEAECRNLLTSLPALVDSQSVREAFAACENKPARLLHLALRHSPIVQKLEEILWKTKGTPIKLTALAQSLWDETSVEACQATTNLLQLGASARDAISELPLVPHRIHLLARPSDGFVVCRNPNCSGGDDRKFNARLGCVTAGFIDRCGYCQSRTLTLCRCQTCGEVSMAGICEDGDFRPVTRHELTGHYQESEKSSVEFQSLNPTATGTTLLTGLVRVNDTCPNCQEKKSWRSFETGSPLTLSIAAETALAELPEYPSPKNEWLPARGRRMLAFSDSRTEAARLGVSLRLQHERQVLRSIFARCIARTPAVNDETIARLKRQIQENERELQTVNSPETRQEIQNELLEKKQRLAEELGGRSIEKWKNLLVQEQGLAELFDFDFGKKHGSSDWTLAAWESNKQKIVKNLDLLLSREIASPSRRFATLETLGLVQLGYPNLEEVQIPMALLGKIPKTGARQKLEESWTDLIAVLCDDLRTKGIVTLGNPDTDSEYQFGRQLIGRWVSKHHDGNQLERFVGDQSRKNNLQRRLKFAVAFLQRCGLGQEATIEKAAELLEYVFEALYQAANDKRIPWLESGRRETREGVADSIRILIPKLTMRRPSNFFRCSTTNFIFTRCVLGITPDADFSKALVSVPQSELEQDGRYGRQRLEYLVSKVFSLGLWSEEHSAQLAPQENRRLQDLFKLGLRNILSSTTTLELGIDIGGLTAVLMGNVPPGKANYLQRAGRAGRRADGSSLVLTFARPRPFDREVFTQFDKYLNAPFRAPRIFLDRERIAQRHLHSLLLGEFFRLVYPPGRHVGAMMAFGNMGAFCGLNRSRIWKRGDARPEISRFQADYASRQETWWGEDPSTLTTKFVDFLDHQKRTRELYEPIKSLLKKTGLETWILNWERLFDAIKADFSNRIDEWQGEYNRLLDVWQQFTEQNNKRVANGVHFQLSHLYEMTVIEALADCQFLPRYGFPIGLLSLKVVDADPEQPNWIREEDQYRLQRPGLQALGEYVPGSQLLVGGKLVTSRGLLKHWTGVNLDSSPGLRGRYSKCINGHVFYVFSESLDKCSICDAVTESNTPNAFLIPKFGFRSAKWDPPKVSGDVEKIGRTERATVTFGRGTVSPYENFGGVSGLSARYKEDGEIFVYNTGDFGKGFIVCLHCGYAESEKKSGEISKDFREHLPLDYSGRSRFSLCPGVNETPLRKQTLAARQATDALLLDFSQFTRLWAEADPILTTLGYALQNSGAKLLGLDTRELGVLTLSKSGVVLYDNVPGGAGHVYELLKAGREWLLAAKEQMVLSAAHDERCETACLDCLLTFDAQIAMGDGSLRRRQACKILSRLLDGEYGVSPRGDDLMSSPSPSQKTKEDRLKAASARRLRREGKSDDV